MKELEKERDGGAGKAGSENDQVCAPKDESRRPVTEQRLRVHAIRPTLSGEGSVHLLQITEGFSLQVKWYRGG